MMACGEGGWVGRGTADAQVVMSAGHDGFVGRWVGRGGGGALHLLQMLK